MRNRILIILLLLPFSLNACAMGPAPTYSIDVRVIDQEGEAIEGARVSGDFHVHSPRERPADNRWFDYTDRNGRVRISGPSLGSVNVQVVKGGFYRSMKQMPLRGQKRHDVEIVLRDIRNPIPMYARNVYINLPSQNQEYGFNFLNSEIAGSESSSAEFHILFNGRIPKFHGSIQDMRALEYEIVVEVSFPNEGDGLILAEPPSGSGESVYKSNYEAPEEGYEGGLTLSTVRASASGTRRVNINQPLYLRVATRLDEDGEVESAIYCKIYPGISLGGATADAPTVRMTYYCNPTPNDRNVEFDTQRNLFADLGPNEQVGAP